MQSEFYNVALDQVRYSLVWEDSQTLNDALQINANDHLLVITSAGCNVLNALLQKPAAVTAIDLNPVQNKLLLLKKHIILHHDFFVYQALLGLKGKEAVNIVTALLLQTLPANEKNYWSCFLHSHPDGLLTSGKLENYITGFYKTLCSEEQDKLQQLITFTDVTAQYHFFIKHLHNSSFRQSFITYFDDENLSKGRDPKLLKYAAETGGQAFYNRLVHQVKTVLTGTNFYFRFFFFGLQHIPEHLLPPCYLEKNYSTLKQQLSKLEVIKGEAIDYLLSTPGIAINKASLSNIFEYTSQQEFEHVCNALAANTDRQLQMVYWNLLNGQGENITNLHPNLKIEKVTPSSQGCFYFKNVMLLHKERTPSS